MRFWAVVSFVIVILSAGLGHAADQNQPMSSSDSSNALTAMAYDGNVGAMMGRLAATAIPSAPAAAFFAPAGIHCPFVIPAGKWVAGFTYGHYSANGILNGTDNVSKEEVWEKYLAAPQSLGIDFYTVSLLRGLTDNLTVVALIPYSARSLTVETRARQVVTMNTDGLGDVQVGGIYRIHQGPTSLWTFYGGLSAPTGSINERGNLPGKTDVKLPYPVQLGTGTVDLYPTLTYMGKCESLLWGAQASGIIHLGTNWDGYRWGDSYELSSWVGYQFFKGLAGSLRLDWQSSGQISGADPELNPLQAPATDPNDFGGDRLLILPGLTWSITNGPLKGNSLVLEGGVPVYQWLTGPQLKMSYLLIAGWKWVF